MGCWRRTKSPSCLDLCSPLIDNHKQNFWRVTGHHTGAINISRSKMSKYGPWYIFSKCLKFELCTSLLSQVTLWQSSIRNHFYSTLSNSLCCCQFFLIRKNTIFWSEENLLPAAWPIYLNGWLNISEWQIPLTHQCGHVLPSLMILNRAATASPRPPR